MSPQIKRGVYKIACGDRFLRDFDGSILVVGGGDHIPFALVNFILRRSLQVTEDITYSGAWTTRAMIHQLLLSLTSEPATMLLLLHLM